MSTVINNQTGLAEDLPEDQAQSALKAGTHSLALNDPDGNPAVAAAEDAPALLDQGYSQPSSDQLQGLLNHAKYGTTGQQILTGLEGAGVGSTFGLSTGLEHQLSNLGVPGISDEDIQQRAAENPGSHALGEGAGLIGTSLIPIAGEANILSKAGSGVQSLLGLGKGAGLLGTMGANAAKFSTEMAIMAAGDENSKYLSNDPNQTAETAASNIGLSALLGAGGGAAFGAVSPLWSIANDTKAGQFIQDFADQIKFRRNNPNPVENLRDELTGYYSDATNAADSVYGPKGIKSQAVAKFMPEMNPAISDQIQSLGDSVGGAIKSLKDDPFVNKLQRATEKWQEAITHPGATSADVFDSTQDFKQQLQEWGKFNKDFVPLAEKEFRQTAKDLAFKVRNSLEDSDVWGKVADYQKSLNGAFKNYLPALQDFESKFTTWIGDNRVIDPTKVNTYVNQMGKPNAEIKQTILENFRDAAEKYKSVIDKTNRNLGIEPQTVPSSMNAINASLQKLSPGAKAANAMVDKGLARLGGNTLGAGLGGAAGAAVGAPGMGALIGEHALGGFFSSILPAIVKPILSATPSGEALKTAAELGSNFLKGESKLSQAAKYVFSPSSNMVVPAYSAASKDRDKLKKKIEEANNDQASLLNVGGQSGYYMPNHAAALAGVAARAVSYLNSVKPNTGKLGPLDPDRKPSDFEEAKYNRALDIADNPMVVLSHVKNGTIIPEDIQTVKTIYPNFYARSVEKLTHELIDHVGKGGTIPYSTRLGLSLYVGKPMDSTMTQQAIVAAQPISQAPMPQQQQMHPTRSSMASIGKVNQLYQMPGESRESAKLTNRS